jgi:acyl-CoA thioesterase-2
MNFRQFQTMLDLVADDAGRMVLPVPNANSERVFGGQILAQLIAAAEGSGSGKSAKSLQVSFPREGKPRKSLYLDLETTHDGRSVGMRRAVVWQHGEQARRTVAIASVLLDEADEGIDYQLEAGPAGDPDEAKPLDIRVVPGEARLISEAGLDDDGIAPAEFGFWLRCPEFEGESLARQVIAYISDWPVIGTLLKAVPGVSQRDAHVKVQTGVVTHSVWFHRPFLATEWLRMEVRGRRQAGGRGFGTGDIYTQAGSLVASFAQENVIRRPR